ncbi:hypothetical protein [Streptomyces sp. NPDC090083]
MHGGAIRRGELLGDAFGHGRTSVRLSLAPYGRAGGRVSGRR